MCGDVNENQKHPHVRGEDTIRAASLYLRRETPPRAWGRHVHSCAFIPLVRNTPTCVGKTICEKMYGNAMEKHPHVRGEDPPTSCPAASLLETPPRAWGRPLLTNMVGAELGNTPTCVGKTDCILVELAHARKHPHVRGEDLRGVRRV